MNGFATALATLLLAGPFSAPALGQTVFLDDFDGDALLPHWYQPPPSAWEHNVSNSMLNVTGLFSPSHPKSPSNFAAMSAPFPPQADFYAEAWMGWESGDQPHRLELSVLGPFGGGSPYLAVMGYRNDGLFGDIPLIYAQPGNAPPVVMPAPPPGMYHFAITRVGTQINFSFNGSPFASFSGTSGITAAHVGFFFLGPYPGELGAFHIDKVQVVPAPGVVAVLLGMTLFCARRRRRCMGRTTT